MNLRRLLSFAIRHHWQFQLQLQAEIRELKREMSSKTPDNPALKGFKVYSQFDEDGILEDIFSRLNLTHGRFLEIGCGDGLENNTHYLALKRWTGRWVDGSSKKISGIRDHIPANDRLEVVERMVNTNNVSDLMEPNPDFLSLDIDGNDYEVLKSLVSVGQPKVICAEYNVKFPPPCRITIGYDPIHSWQMDDYFGASLQMFVDLLKSYTLVSCGLTGANAFFVRNDLAGAFTKYSTEQLYQTHRAHLVFLESGAPSTFRYLHNAVASAIRHEDQTIPTHDPALR